MPLTLQPFVLKNTSLTLVKTADIGTALEEEYICQLTAVTLTPGTSTAGGGSALETFCDTFPIEGQSSAAWTIELAGFQQFQQAIDFSLMAFNNEGEKYTYTLVPGADGTNVISATNPGFTGECTMVATVIGGTAKTHAVFTVSLPCVSKPTMIVVP